MNVIVKGEVVPLDAAPLLGIGGEGRVYRHKDRALKVFHDVPPNDIAALAARAGKVAKLRVFPRSLPAAVAGPRDLATDAKGNIVGFTMSIIDGGTDAMQLSQRRWREGVMSNSEVIALFRLLRALLVDLHARGVIVGDLNDGNVLFKGGSPFLIDADSMQFGAYPCSVAHERFLDPILYGRDLTASPAFTADTDWYAFAVMLFASLSYVHPYGGQHGTLPTMLRRAEARHSVMRDDVRIPRSATPPGALPEPLLAWFRSVFDDGVRGALPSALLDARWTKCACGLEHARSRCPSCDAAQTTRVPAARGRLRIKTVLETRGRIVACILQGGLRYAHEQDGSIFREDGRRAAPAFPGTRVRVVLEGGTTWIGKEDRVIGYCNERETRALTVSTYRGEPVFDANAFGCVYAENALLKSASTGKHIGSIYDGQTFMRLGERLGFGFYRAGLRTFGFLFHAERGGLTACTIPALEGRIVDTSVFFDDDRALFCVATEKDGKRAHALHLFDQRGTRIASVCGAPEDRPILGSIHGKCLAFGSILSATDEGLLLARVDTAKGSIVEEKVFPETREFVGSTSDLLAASGGALYVVSERAILHLSLL